MQWIATCNATTMTMDDVVIIMKNITQFSIKTLDIILQIIATYINSIKLHTIINLR